MSKSKKSKSPKIDPRVLTRPRLDALFERHARGELDLDGLEAGVRALMAEAGHGPVLEALVKRMEGTPEQERETLMALVERLRSREVIDYLWQQVKKPGALSLDAKMTALVVLKQMGEDVDIADPGRYFSPRDIRPGDVRTAENMLRLGLRGLARAVREARDVVEVERIMLDINRMPEQALDAEGILLHFVADAEAEDTDLGADFLYALARTTPFPQAQQAAERVLVRLAARGVQPVTPVILSLGQEKFYACYMTDPNHPWQQSVNVAWERAGGVVQALVFLLDFGAPWRGALKDAFATQGMSPEKYRREFVERAEARMGERVYRVSLARAQATIAAAVEANRKNKIPLPKEFNEMRHLVERWVLHPPAAVLQADTSEDELSGLPLVPDHSQKPLVVDLRGARGKQVLSLLNQQAEEAGEDDFEFEEEEWLDDEDEFYSFDEIVEAIENAHADEVEAMPWAPCWQPDWIRDYLASLCPDPDRLDDLSNFDDEFQYMKDEWWTLDDFAGYLSDHAYEIRALADLRGFHLSEYLREDAFEWDDDHGRSRLETLRDFLAYLASRGLLPGEAPVLADLEQMLAQTETVILLDRPLPLGGETAIWLPEFGAGREERFTFNEWWLALVLEGKFKRNWDKMRREAQKKPAAAAKLALLQRLENRLAEDAEYLDSLDDYLPPTPADKKHAQQWFERETVNEARAW